MKKKRDRLDAGLRAFCAAARWARADLSAMRPRAAGGWRVAAAVLVLMTAIPSWAEDDAQEALTRTVLNPGAPPPTTSGSASSTALVTWGSPASTRLPRGALHRPPERPDGKGPPPQRATRRRGHRRAS